MSYGLEDWPEWLRRFVGGAAVADRTFSPRATVLFIDREEGYYLKIAPRGCLAREAWMTAYLYEKGTSELRLVPQVADYRSEDRDYLLTRRLPGENGIGARCLAQPERLSRAFGESLRLLHQVPWGDCPVQVNEELLAGAEALRGQTDPWQLDYTDIRDPEEAYACLRAEKGRLKSDALLHGDACLPNLLLEDFRLTGFIDLGAGGVGDRHIDLFWALWSLEFNLHTGAYADAFLDAYGREAFDPERLRLCTMLIALNQPKQVKG
jgi:kanamycin kinase